MKTTLVVLNKIMEAKYMQHTYKDTHKSQIFHNDDHYYNTNYTKNCNAL